MERIKMREHIRTNRLKGQKAKRLKELFAYLFVCLFSFICFQFPSVAFARISLLQPWVLNDRQETREKKIDQSAGFGFGVNGVSPAGAHTDTNFILFPYTLSYGLREKLEVGAGWGLQSLSRKKEGSQFSISDLVIASRWRFFEPDRTKRIPGLDMEFGFSFPTASFDKGLGTGALGLLFSWGLVLPLDPVRAHFGLGFRYNFENADKVQVGTVFSYTGGLTYPLKNIKEKIYLTGEVKGFNHARNRKSGTNEGPAPDELYLSPGIKWELHKRFHFLGALLIGLTAESSDVGMNLELRF